jgi:hypothetical protein
MTNSSTVRRLVAEAEEMRRLDAEAEHAMQMLSYGLLAFVFVTLMAATAVAFWWGGML